MSVAGIPFEIFAQILANVWNTFGIPLLLGTFISGITQKVKIMEYFLPSVADGNRYSIQIFLAGAAVLIQGLYMLINTHGIDWSVLLDAGKAYAGAAVAYSHFFKPIENK